MSNEIKYLNNLIAAQSELIKDQSDRLKLGCTMTAHIAARDSVIKDQQATINQLKKNAEQARLKACNTWALVNEQPPNGIPLVCYHPDWIDEDFNPNGVREGFYNLNGEPDDWTTAKWNNCSDRYMTFYDTPSHWMLPEPLEVTELKAAPPPPWLSVELFEKSGYHGRCWIRYKGKPVICHYTGALYTFSRGSGVYMSECISGVIPLPTPSAEL